MAKVITERGLLDEAELKWRLWREDNGDSWAIIHELMDDTGQSVRRDTWVNFKGAPIPASSAEQGDM